MHKPNAQPPDGGLRHRVSIQWVLTVLIAGLLIIVSVGIISDFVRHLAEYRQTQTLRRAEVTIGHLVRAAQHLAFERGRTSVVLHAGQPVGADDRKFLDQRRALSDGEFAATLQRLDESHAALARKLSRQGQVIAELRLRADALLAVPQDQRDPLFADQWFNAVSAILASVPESVFLLAATDSLPPLTRITLQAFDLRNALGVESSRIAAALAAGKVPAQPDMQELSRLRGQGDTALNNLRREVALTNNTALREALLRVDTEVLRNFRPLQDVVLRAFTDGRVPQEPVGHYTSASVPALDAAAAIMAVATQEGVLAANQAETHARLVMASYAGLLLVSCLLAMAAVLLVSRAMASALALRRHLVDLAANRLDQPLSARIVGRELMETAEVAGTLRLSLLERRRMEREVKDLSRQNRLILENAADGLIALDGDGLTVFANPAAQHLTGWSLAEMEGRPHHDLIHHSLADGTPKPKTDCPVHQTLVDGKPRYVEDDLFWRKDGTSFPVELSVNAWDDGDQRGAVVVFRDIAVRKRVEAKNQILVDELRRSNADLENFAYAISHDLQAPLRSVSGFVTLSRRALAPHLDNDTREFMEFAEQGAQRMSAMIAALLDYARIGTRGAAPRPVSVGQVVDVVLTDLAPVIAETGGKVSVAEALPMVMADPPQLTSVLQNLIGNALKYGSTTHPAHVRVAAVRRKDRTIITVSDDGPGIPEDQREVIFGLFKRGGVHDGIDGLGMGLAICRRIVDRLGGTIHAEEAPGGGACFVIDLRSASGLV
ncbi:sensor histidine kinase [Magnetospirillum sulfuroxidans]|uniref:histidine kinase n=1 Tax=Magnetospirillum sulfuroxidans TaxID=611300 RepID=A0ABS5IBW0_9PROT|nr:ATP-binding protein [Magnetospirillum sulfuroxidans]MBR9971905.1 PAS domain S-box protein [Magnetospirillum sulfuroxidans]